MFKVAHTCDDHGQLIFHAIIDRVLVPDRSPWLDKGRHACRMGDLYGIIEREERVARQDRAVQIKIELGGFCYGLPHGIDTAGLTATLAHQL